MKRGQHHLDSNFVAESWHVGLFTNQVDAGCADILAEPTSKHLWVLRVVPEQDWRLNGETPVRSSFGVFCNAIGYHRCSPPHPATIRPQLPGNKRYKVRRADRPQAATSVEQEEHTAMFLAEDLQ